MCVCECTCGVIVKADGVMRPFSIGCVSVQVCVWMSVVHCCWVWLARAMFSHNLHCVLHCCSMGCEKLPAC